LANYWGIKVGGLPDKFYTNNLYPALFGGFRTEYRIAGVKIIIIDVWPGLFLPIGNFPNNQLLGVNILFKQGTVKIAEVIHDTKNTPGGKVFVVT
jgi:hypothetical protein